MRIYKSTDLTLDVEYTEEFFINWTKDVVEQCMECLREDLNSIDD